jgi:hypothetical protein
MQSRFNTRNVTASFLAMLLLGMPGTVATQERSAAEELLRKELDAMKLQLQRVEQQMRQQEELIRRLTGERPGAAPAVPPAPAPPAVAPPVAAPAPATGVNEEALKQAILQELRPQLAAANKTFPSQFNPAIGFVVDTVFSHTRQDKSNFEFRSGELGISASVDPFARAYAIINGTSDSVSVEEAAIVTTSLPWGLTVKGGRFFAEFGRLSTFHDHDLPFVNRPLVLDRYIGGESQADGVEVSWLVPIPQYLTLTAGMYNKIGADNDRVDNKVARDLSEFTYLARVHTFFNLTDALGLDVGATDAYTPEVRAEGLKSRNLFGVDLTLRYTPLESALYRGLIWGTELLVNHEARPVAAVRTDTVVLADGTVTTVDTPITLFKNRDAFGLYSYVETRLSRRYYPGVLVEYVEDIDRPRASTWAVSPYFTIWASEFNRLRLQYTRVETTTPGSPRRTDDQFFLQWTIVMGSHVHGFRDR